MLWAMTESCKIGLNRRIKKPPALITPACINAETGVGVSIVSDRFMGSIEMITAQEKEVTLKDPKTGRNQVVIVKVSCTSILRLRSSLSQYRL